MGKEAVLVCGTCDLVVKGGVLNELEIVLAILNLMYKIYNIMYLYINI